MTSVQSAPRIRALDAHVHFWDPAELRYPWLDAAPALRRAFLPRDYVAVEKNEVAGVVFVEANCASDQASREVEFISDMREAYPWIAGIVAFVDLLDENASSAIAALAKRTDVVGVRHNIQGHTSGFCLQPAFVRGVQAVGAHALVFELCATFDQLDDVSQLVEQCPRTQFVLDHCGKPDIAKGGGDAWRPALASLARYPNVVCKISGLFSEARPVQRTSTALAPYVDHVRECFGPVRLLYGSDWPVVTASGGGPAWRDVIEACTSTWPNAERRAFFLGNAARVYQLAHLFDA